MTTAITERRMPQTPTLGVANDRARVMAHAPVRIRWLAALLVFLGVGFFGGIGGWAALAPLRSAVIAPGAIKVAGDRLVVQHYEGGIIRHIHVREGSVVEEGELLLELDDTRAVATLGVLKNQLAGSLATSARLEAEFHGLDTVAIGPELEALLDEYPDMRGTVENEMDVFESNRRLTEGQIAILNDRIAQLEENVAGLGKRRDAFAGQLALIEEELVDLDVLLSKGLIPKPRILTRRREQTALMGDVSLAEAEILSVAQQITEFRERILQVRRDRLTQVSDARRLVKEQIFDLRQRIAANEDIARRHKVRAPSTGQVVGLQVNTIGEVIAPGQQLLEIVPGDADYVVEARVRPDDIDQVVSGSEARVRLTAFNFRTTPPVPARVTDVSADVFTDPVNETTYYRVDLILDQAAMDDLGIEVPTLPGMQAQVMISTGQQTVVDYVLGPIVGGLETALLESD